MKTGEPVAELDLTESQLALERIAGTLAITDNKQDQARLELDPALSDLDARIERKTLEAEILEQEPSRISGSPNRALRSNSWETPVSPRVRRLSKSPSSSGSG